MKTFSTAFASHLASGATTLCWCWRLTRRDGLRMGFTDHDRDVVFDATTFEAAAGFTASEMKDAVGLGVDNHEVESALSSGRLSEADLAAGLYDDAQVEIFRVNWSSPAQRALMRTGSLGEVRRSGLSFAAEVRGLAHYLQQTSGRVYQYGCDADLGDRRCRIDLKAAAYRATARSRPRMGDATCVSTASRPSPTAGSHVAYSRSSPDRMRPRPSRSNITGRLARRSSSSSGKRRHMRSRPQRRSR